MRGRQFESTVLAEDPPPPMPAKKRTHYWAEKLDRVRAHGGNWCCVLESTKSTVSATKRWMRYTPLAAEFEVESRVEAEGGRKVHRLYARFVGSGRPVVEGV